MPELHIVAGPNGAGKTSAFKAIVPQGVDYLNADLIVKEIKEKAGGLNVQDIANGEVMNIFYQKIARNESFAIETNLCDDPTYKSFQELQRKGYDIYVYFLCVDDVNICINRVNLRVRQGGHNINPDVIQQRYTTGLALLKHYRDFPDVLMLLDNTEGVMNLEAELRRGVVKFRAHSETEWVKSIFDTSRVQKKDPKDESIEEVRRKYKGRKL